MRFWVGVTAAFGAGTLVGAAVIRYTMEDKLKKEYEQSVASMRRVLLAQKIDAETPVATEEELDEPLPIILQQRGEGVQLTAAAEFAERVAVNENKKAPDFKPEPPVASITTLKDRQITNPYHQAVVEKGFASFAELDPEEYFDEGDGREKDQLTMVYTDNTPHFFNGSEEIDDWMDRVGATIVDDMRKAVGEGNPVLYIRNNTTDVDYEVIFEQP